MTTEIISKACTKCMSVKLFTEFANDNCCGRHGLKPHCKSCGSAATKEWRKRNSEKVKASRAAKYAANSEANKAKSSAWYLANREQAAETGSAWQKANPEKVNKASAKYRAAHPEKRRAIVHNSRARNRGTDGVLSLGLVKRLFALQKGKCACCGQPLIKYHLDHITPMALGGRNEDSNIQLLLPQCNMQKNAKHPIDFMHERGLLC